jgi:hypothetical protein
VLAGVAAAAAVLLLLQEVVAVAAVADIAAAITNASALATCVYCSMNTAHVIVDCEAQSSSIQDVHHHSIALHTHYISHFNNKLPSMKLKSAILHAR